MRDDILNDEDWMRICLDLALRAEGQTSPNPMVGAVVLDVNGELVAEGYHRRAGEAHAEKIALEMAGERARGGTLYANLEPCKHKKNRRTTPCAPIVLNSGIARLVVGQLDPIRAHGGGAAWLEEKGISVTCGVLEAECKEINRAFMTWARKGRPLFVLKAATSIDGKIATRTGESKWITGVLARADGRQLRARLDAILVGVETVLSDDPRLTADQAGKRDPVRIVLDSSLRTPSSARLLPKNTTSKAKVVVVTTMNSSDSRADALRSSGVEVLRLESENKRPSLPALAKVLAERGVTSVLVEGGADVHDAFMSAGLCDELRLYMAPKALGGGGKSWLGGLGVASLQDAYRLRWHGDAIRLGDDILMIARPDPIAHPGYQGERPVKSTV